MIISDAGARAAALDISRSFVCEAPAGSGKTELLTQRFLKLLAVVEYPEQVWAITFTRKAASEMQERIIRSLALGNGPAPDEAHQQVTWQLARQVLENDRNRQWHLSANPARLNIRTFDSLCTFLVRTLPLDSALGASVQPLENAWPLYREAVAALLSSHSRAADSDWGEALERLLAHRDNQWQDFETLACEMLAHREQWLHALPLIMGDRDPQQDFTLLQEMLQQHSQESLVAIDRHLGSCRSELEDLLSWAGRHLNEHHAGQWPERICLVPEPENISSFRLLAQTALTATGSWRRRLDKNCGFPAGKGEAADKKAAMLTVIKELSGIAGLDWLLTQLLCLPEQNNSGAEQQVLVDILTLLPRLVAHLNLVFRERNAVDFSEISLRALQALGQPDAPSELALALDYQLQHLMVDEFQDTSVSQARLLTALTSEWQPGDGKTLFCVGDAMQSVYGFRAAKVSLFMEIRDRGLGSLVMETLRLECNFRSHSHVIDWVNQSFAAVMPEQDNLQYSAVCYHHSVPVKPALADHGVAIRGFSDDPGGQAEADFICTEISRLRQKEPDSSIAVLARNRGHLSRIIARLKAARIPLLAVDLYPLMQMPVMNDLYLVHEAIRYPENHQTWLALMRSPLLGLSTDQLEYLSDQASEQEICLSALICSLTDIPAGIPEDRGTQLLRFAGIMSEALSFCRRYSEHQWLRIVWHQLGGDLYYASDDERQAVSSYLHMITGMDQPVEFTLLQEKLARLYARPESQAENPVQLMTMHKSKGLEFDHVFLPVLARRGRTSDPAILRWEEVISAQGSGTQLLISPVAAKGAERYPLYEYLERFDRQKQLYEQARLLYVACTRAVRSLTLSFHLERSKKQPDQVQPPSSATLAGQIWPAVVDQLQLHESASATEQSPNTPAAERMRVVYTINRPDPGESPLKPWQLEPPVNEHPLNHPEFSMNFLEQKTGTAVHRFFEFLDRDWQRAVSVTDSWLNREIRIQGIPVSRQQEFRIRCHELISNAINDPEFCKLYNDGNTFSASEYSLKIRRGRHIQTLIIDRVVSMDKRTLLVDFKTSRPAAGQTQAAFLEQEQSVYADKMDLYRRALAGAGFENIEMFLYFPSISCWHPLN